MRAAVSAMLSVFMLIGMPVALGPSALLAILFLGQDSLASLALKLCEPSGHFTLLATACAFFLAVFVHRDIRFVQAPHALVDAAKVTVMPMFIIANALRHAHVLTAERIPRMLAEQIIARGMPPWGVNRP